MITEIDFTQYRFSEEIFLKVIRRLQTTPSVLQITIKTEAMSPNQLSALKTLVSSNHRKGMRVKDSDQKKLPYSLDPSDYIKAKSNIVDFSKMRETTKGAFQRYLELYSELPKTIIDFGAGTGACAIPLVLLGCPLIYAVDADEESLDILDSRLKQAISIQDKGSPETNDGQVIRVVSPFINTIMPQADLLISSFTLPYRNPDEFPAIWNKAVSCVRPGGIFAGHLFTRSDDSDNEMMTYHTMDEAKKMFSENFEILWLKEQVEGIEIVNGDNAGGTTIDVQREWGSLIHFVLRKKTLSDYQSE